MNNFQKVRATREKLQENIPNFRTLPPELKIYGACPAGSHGTNYIKSHTKLVQCTVSHCFRHQMNKGKEKQLKLNESDQYGTDTEQQMRKYGKGAAGEEGRKGGGR